ncbi:histone deacetylase [Senna tora]|uniref:Histone deacetylase n=1 Tax=Senna tora TaxID=362788 RepID=A0A834W2X9_9FABA|nr:histone deacetylase [Senna tora]
MAEKAVLDDPQTPQSSSTSSIPLIEKEKNVIAFNHNLSVKLDDKNYLLWRQQILAALEGHDLEKYVAGSRFVPPKFDTEGDREAGKLNLSYLKWKKQDKLILSWLLGSMTESMLTHVNECEHSYEAWNIMIEQFGINTKARVHLYRTELRGIKKGLPQEYESFVTSANMKSDLASIGELEALLVAQEVRVDKSLKAVKTADTPSANVASVDQKEKTNQNKNNQPRPFRAFNNFRGGRNGGGRFNNYRGGFARGRGGSNFNQGFNRPFVVCQVCSKTGHIASQCYNRYDSNYQLSQQQYSQNFTQARQRSSGNMSAMVATPDAITDAAWFPDSGATNHVTSDASNLMYGVEYSGAEQLHMGNGKGLLISNIGQSLVKSSFQPSLNLVLNNLLHVPSITKNLASVSKFAKDNSVFFEFHFDACYVKSQATKATLLKGSIRPDGLYYFTDFQLLHQSSQPPCTSRSYDSSVNLCSSSASPIVLASTVGSSISNSVTSNCTAVTPYTLWHCRLGHCNSATVMEVLKQCNVSVSNKGAFEFCEACCNGKHHKLPHPPSPNVYNTPLELIYTDLWGPSPIKSRNGASYYISFIDACSRFTWIYPLKLKSDALKAFVDFKKMIELQTGYSTVHKGYKCLAPDGRIYISRDVKFDEVSFPYKNTSSTPSIPVSPNVSSFSSASPPLAVQYESSINPIIVTSTDNCNVSATNEVSSGSESTGVVGSAMSHDAGNNSASPDPKAVSIDQAQNVHPMVTRAKAGVFKPKILLAHMVPTARLASTLVRFGFVPSRCDPSLFVYHAHNVLTFVLVYVDDIIITGSSSQFISQLKCRLNAEFSLKDLGKLHYFLGIEVNHLSDGSLHLSQGKYIQDLLVKSKMDGACAISTPMVSNAKLSKDEYVSSLESSKSVRVCYKLVQLSVIDLSM